MRQYILNKTFIFTLLAATVTTGLAFMPMAAGKGASPEFVGDMAITIIFAVSSSLLLALTVVPVY